MVFRLSNNKDGLERSNSAMTDVGAAIQTAPRYGAGAQLSHLAEESPGGSASWTLASSVARTRWTRFGPSQQERNAMVSRLKY